MGGTLGEFLDGLTREQQTQALASLAREGGPWREEAAGLLTGNFEPFFAALWRDARRDPVSALTDSRRRWRKTCSHSKAQEVLRRAGKEAFLEQARSAFGLLLAQYTGANGKSLAAFIEEYLPLRMVGWLNAETRQAETLETSARLEEPRQTRRAQRGRHSSPVEVAVVLAINSFDDWLENHRVREHVRKTLAANGVAMPPGASFRAMAEEIWKREWLIKPVFSPGNSRRATKVSNQVKGRRFPLLVGMNDADLGDLLQTPAFQDRLRQRADSTPDRCWKVLLALYGPGRAPTQTELAAQMGIKQGKVSRLRQTGLRRLLSECLDEYRRTHAGKRAV